MSSGRILLLIILLRTYLVLNESNGSSREPISLEIWNRVRRGKVIVEQQKIGLISLISSIYSTRPFIHFITNK